MAGDLDALNDRYVLQAPIAFDIEPIGRDARREWFTHYAARRRHRLLVAVDDGRLVGYTTSTPWRPKRAYETSVETIVYVAPDSTGRGIGSQLHTALLKALAREDVHRAYAGITQPNPASVALHERFGIFAEQGRSSAATGTWPGTRSR